MRIYVSYFYQIRFFPSNLIPLSTAKWDPKWFHNNNHQDYQFKDRRGVLNGLRADPFVPGEQCNGLCHGPETCYQTPSECKFFQAYYGQLALLDFQKIILRFDSLAEQIKNDNKFDDVDFALIVHEAPDNPCSERIMLQRWFAAHGYQLNEWSKDSI